MSMNEETYLSAVNYAIEHMYYAPASVLRKLTALSASLSKKSRSNSVKQEPTPRQQENTALKADIVAWMKPYAWYCVADVWKGVPSFESVKDMTHNRVAELLAQLVKEQTVLRGQIGGEALFTLVKV